MSVKRIGEILQEMGYSTEPSLYEYEQPKKDHYPRGEQCGKVMFPSDTTAKAGARALLKHKKGNTSKLRTYLCPDCKAYHISSSFHN